jgi:hypothetical protein
MLYKSPISENKVANQVNYGMKDMTQQKAS